MIITFLGYPCGILKTGYIYLHNIIYENTHNYIIGITNVWYADFNISTYS